METSLYRYYPLVNPLAKMRELEKIPLFHLFTINSHQQILNQNHSEILTAGTLTLKDWSWGNGGKYPTNFPPPAGCWFSHPFEKILSSNWSIFPKVRGEDKQALKFHHLERGFLELRVLGTNQQQLWDLKLGIIICQRPKFSIANFKVGLLQSL